MRGERAVRGRRLEHRELAGHGRSVRPSVRIARGRAGSPERGRAARWRGRAARSRARRRPWRTTPSTSRRRPTRRTSRRLSGMPGRRAPARPATCRPSRSRASGSDQPRERMPPEPRRDRHRIAEPHVLAGQDVRLADAAAVERRDDARRDVLDVDGRDARCPRTPRSGACRRRRPRAAAPMPEWSPRAVGHAGHDDDDRAPRPRCAPRPRGGPGTSSRRSSSGSPSPRSRRYFSSTIRPCVSPNMLTVET